MRFKNAVPSLPCCPACPMGAEKRLLAVIVTVMICDLKAALVRTITRGPAVAAVVVEFFWMVRGGFRN